MSAPGTPYPEHMLCAMPINQLFRHLCKVRDADDQAAERQARCVLAKRLERDVMRVIGRRVATDACGDVWGEVLKSVVSSRFRQRTLSEFRAWLLRIARRRVADLYRSPSRRVRVASLDATDEHGRPLHHPACDGGISASNLAVRIEDQRRRAQLKPHHRAALLLHVDCDLPAAEVAQLVPDVSADNVAQIHSRHRRALRGALADAA